MKRYIILIASLLLMVACDKPFEMDLPLSVAQRKITLSKDAGSTHVLVYADGDWKASFTQPVEWASLNKITGSGNSDLVFTYSANYGIARKVGIVLTKDELRDTVFMIQEGPVTLATYKLESSSVELTKIAGDAVIKASSNLYYSEDALKVTAIYTDAEGKKDTVAVDGTSSDPAHWVTAVQTKYDRFSFTALANDIGASRNADLVITIDDPTGRPLKSILKVTQTTASPKFIMTTVAGTYESEAQKDIVVKVSFNNIWPYADNIFYEMTDQVKEWVSNVRLTAAGLSFSLSENTTGKMRVGKISIQYVADSGETAKATFMITQK